MGIIKALKLGFDYQRYDDDGNVVDMQRAVNDVDLDIKAGEFVAVLGHNGSGKSTLAKHMNALLIPTEGTMLVDGIDTARETKLWKVRQKAGMVFQNPDNQIIGTVVEEDVGFGPENMGVPTDDIWKWVNDSLEKVGMTAYRYQSPNKLSGGQKQRVAIAGVMAMRPRCIILDEPTAALTRNESEKLYTLVDKLKENGVSIIFISHRFEDMYRLASRVTVFRDSQYIGTYDVNGITNADLIKAMVGREINDLFPKPEVKLGDEMLRIEHLSRTGFFKDVSFNVRAGEIVGLTGLVGAGRTEVMEAVSGITHPDEGKVFLEGKEVYIKTPSEAMEKGIILLPEDRQKQGLVMSWGLGRNVTLPIISKYAKSGFNDEKAERELSKKLLEEVDTKAVDIFQPASSLSGGNQQKVVVAKALAQEMKVVIMDEPTNGVDVGAKAEIYAIMGDLAKKGYAIILISSEMPEILGMSDRIIVMCNGRKTGELNRGEATQEGILELSMEKSTGKGTK